MIPDVVFHSDYVAPLPPGHRFPMPKFGALQAMLKRRGLLTDRYEHQPEPAQASSITKAHSQRYVDQVLTQSLSPNDEKRLGLPVTAAVARRALAAVGGTILTARLALLGGMAVNLAGGSHHAFAKYGSGFCVFNDVAIATRMLISERLIQKVLVIDLDVHQGDGTADILGKDDGVLTLSVHCRSNFPAIKTFSHLDIALEAGTEDGPYMTMLQHLLPGLIGRHQPDLVFYNAGVDPHRDDRLGRLGLSDQGLAQREAFVLETCRQNGVPLAVVLGGGYDDNVETIANRHAILHAVARDLPNW